MTFWCGSGSADPCLWLMDPDPAIFVTDLRDANKKLNLKKVFLLITLWSLWLVYPDPKTCGSGFGSKTLTFYINREIRRKFTITKMLEAWGMTIGPFSMKPNNLFMFFSFMGETEGYFARYTCRCSCPQARIFASSPLGSARLPATANHFHHRSHPPPPALSAQAEVFHSRHPPHPLPQPRRSCQNYPAAGHRSTHPPLEQCRSFLLLHRWLPTESAAGPTWNCWAGSVRAGIDPSATALARRPCSAQSPALPQCQGSLFSPQSLPAPRNLTGFWKAPAYLIVRRTRRFWIGPTFPHRTWRWVLCCRGTCLKSPGPSHWKKLSQEWEQQNVRRFSPSCIRRFSPSCIRRFAPSCIRRSPEWWRQSAWELSETGPQNRILSIWTGVVA